MNNKYADMSSLFFLTSMGDIRKMYGAVHWLMRAYEDYRNRVFNKQIGYKAFMEENLVRLSMPILIDESTSYQDLEQEVIDRDKVKHILKNRKFTEKCFATGTFEKENAIRMIRDYNCLDVLRTEAELSNSPIANYPQKVKDELAKLFCKHKLLSPDISADDLILLLTTGKPSCSYSIPTFTRNRDIGLVLNILVSVGALTRKWPSIICKHGMLITSSGEKMTSKNLSAAAHKFDNYVIYEFDDKQKEIESDVIKVLAGLPDEIKDLRK